MAILMGFDGHFVDKRHLSLYLQKNIFPFLHRSKVLICHSWDTNETFRSEKPSVAIILRYIDKMTGL